MLSRDVRDAVYLLLGPIFGGLWAALVGGLFLAGVFTKFAPMAVVLCLAALLSLHPIGRFERFLVRALLGHDIPAPAPIGYHRPTTVAGGGSPIGGGGRSRSSATPPAGGCWRGRWCGR